MADGEINKLELMVSVNEFVTWEKKDLKGKMLDKRLSKC